MQKFRNLDSGILSILSSSSLLARVYVRLLEVENSRGRIGRFRDLKSSSLNGQMRARLKLLTWRHMLQDSRIGS
jgi:hypothetical protein